MPKLKLRPLVSLGLLACLLLCAARVRARHDPTNDQTVNFTTQPSAPTATPVSAGDLLISEFRLDGPNGVADEFIELYNNTNQPLTVGATDGSAGWAIALAVTCAICDFGDPEFPRERIYPYVVIPNGTTIPARGHLLWTNNYTDNNNVYRGYSLKNYGGPDKAVGDLSGNFRFFIEGPGDEDFDGFALFTSANQSNWTQATRLDAVGSNYNSNGQLLPLFVEGTGIALYGDYIPIDQYSWLRRMETGVPQDTNNNANDFVLVSPQGSFIATSNSQTIVTTLGAPGPENLSSPIQRNARIKASLIEPQQLSTNPPNRVRDPTPNVCGNADTCAQGTLTIRRKFTNKTGLSVTALRFRIVDITTLHTPNPGGAQADLRALDAADVSIPVTSGGTVLVKGTTVEQPPAQTLGGGLNSSLVVALPSGPLAPNAAVNVQLVLGVQQGGTFRFLVNVEASSGAAAGLQQSKGARPGKLSNN